MLRKVFRTTRGVYSLGLLLCLAVLLPAVADAQTRCAIKPAKEAMTQLDPELRRIVAQRPDSVIGVLLRTRQEIGDPERPALEACGLQIGSVIGDIVTGRIRADAAEQLARHPLVAYMELSRNVRIPPPVLRQDTVPPEPKRPPR
ncbi:MAG TPA: hypothetical protein VGR27_05320 [Longimicrobiaceae bacterium]|nr:hypothetical protein [Longimicrobiaceae bacterium]